MQQHHFLSPFCLWLMINALTHSVSGQNVSTNAPADPPASQKGLTITPSDTKIIPNMTDYLKVSCKYSKPENDQILSVMSLVLSYWNRVKSSFEILTLVTHVNPHNVMVIRDIGATASGDLNQNGETFLTLEWEYPDQDVATRYQCFLNTMGEMGSTYGTKVGAKVNLESNNVSSLAKEMLELKKKMAEQKKEQEEQNKKLAQQREELNLMKHRTVPVNDSGVIIDQQRLYWFDTKLNFNYAQIICVSTGGKLAEISFEKLKAAVPQLKAAGMKNHWYWIGLLRRTGSSGWVWASDERSAGTPPWTHTPGSTELRSSFRYTDSAFEPDYLVDPQYVLCTRPV